MPASLAVIAADKLSGSRLLIANMIPICISEDIEAAKAINRKTLSRYALLANYRNYWKEAGYVERK